MRKPVRIVGNDKTYTFNGKISGGLERGLNTMLGLEGDKQLKVSSFEPFVMPIEVYFELFTKKSVVSKYLLENSTKDQLFSFFELELAIVITSLARKIPPAAMKDKLAALEFEPKDRENFITLEEKICGMLSGIFRGISSKKITLSLDPERLKYSTSSLNESICDSRTEYVVLLTNVTIPGQAVRKVTFLLPQSLYEEFSGTDIDLKDVQKKRFLVYSWNAETSEKIRIEGKTHHSAITIAESKEDIFARDIPDLVGLAIELEKLSFPISVSETVYLKRLLAVVQQKRLPLCLTIPGATEEQLAAVKKLGFKLVLAAPLDKVFPSWSKTIV